MPDSVSMPDCMSMDCMPMPSFEDCSRGNGYQSHSHDLIDNGLLFFTNTGHMETMYTTPPLPYSAWDQVGEVYVCWLRSKHRRVQWVRRPGKKLGAAMG